VDMFVHYPPGLTQELGKKLEALTPDGLKLVMVSNRGVKVYPGGLEGHHHRRQLAVPVPEPRRRRRSRTSRSSACWRKWKRRVWTSSRPRTCARSTASRVLARAGSVKQARMSTAPLVGVIMGSQSDWETMQHACATLEEFGVAYRKTHRLGPPHARSDGRIRQERARAGVGSDYRGGGRGGAPAGDDGLAHDAAGAGRAGAKRRR
jgi:hypothetical protein